MWRAGSWQSAVLEQAGDSQGCETGRGTGRARQGASAGVTASRTVTENRERPGHLCETPRPAVFTDIVGF